MYILTVHFPKAKGATFDFDHFRSTHIPKIGKAFRPFGLGYGAVFRGEESVGGGDPAYFALMVLSFESEKGARDEVASEAGKAALEEVAGFTDVTPVMQFSTAVE